MKSEKKTKSKSKGKRKRSESTESSSDERSKRRKAKESKSKTEDLLQSISSSIVGRKVWVLADLRAHCLLGVFSNESGARKVKKEEEDAAEEGDEMDIRLFTAEIE